MRKGAVSLDAFLFARAHDRRLARLTHDVPLPRCRGLEFGPGDNPTSLPDGIEVTYVSHTLDVDPACLAIDVAWSGTGALAPRLGGEAYDFAIAAQVAQYVPNLLGWFAGIYEVLRPGAVMNLTVPDKRYMFDAMRPASTIAELYDAHLAKLAKPSPRQHFSHVFDTRRVDPVSLWDGAAASSFPRLCGDSAIDLAKARVDEALAGDIYADCHCWVFTPASFLGIVDEASHLGLFPFVLNNIAPPERGNCEFFVSMRRDVVEEPSARRSLQVDALAHLRSVPGL